MSNELIIAMLQSRLDTLKREVALAESPVQILLVSARDREIWTKQTKESMAEIEVSIATLLRSK